MASWVNRTIAAKDNGAEPEKDAERDNGGPRTLQDAFEAGRLEQQAKEVEDSSTPFAELDSARTWQQRSSEQRAHDERIRRLQGTVKRDPAAKRLQQYMEGMEDQLPAGAAARCKPFMPVLTVLVYVIYYLGKYVAFLWGVAFKLWEMAPQTVLKIVYGLALCFFGGTYVVSIAALEAFMAAGWRRAYYSSLVLYDDSRRITYAIEEDQYKDEDKDGIADVDQISGRELIRRQMRVAMRTVERPQETEIAFGNVWAAYLATLATLKFQFARTTAFAVGMAQSTKFFFYKIAGPPLAAALPSDTHHW